MQNEFSKLKIARFYGSVTMLYLVTLLFAWYLFNPYTFLGQKAKTLAYSPDFNQPVSQEIKPAAKIITGKPVRLVISALSIDLPVDEGHYNENDQTWTLSEKHAHYAMPSVYANNVRGNTLIYGHYNVYVFINLKNIQPGGVAEVHTDNGHIFAYSFKSAETLKPHDVTVFDYQSYPRLTLQTCTGDFYEFRQLFHFNLVSIDGKNV
jgi:LPXTG-site transpeptidase (sortase) family protein